MNDARVSVHDPSVSISLSTQYGYQRLFLSSGLSADLCIVNHRAIEIGKLEEYLDIGATWTGI